MTVDVPRDLTAERTVLGAMMLDATAVAAAGEIVGAGDFYRGAHRTVYEAIRAMFEAGRDVDPVTVADELARRGHLADAGGREALADMMHAAPAAAVCARHAEIVADHATRRRVVEQADALRSAALDPSCDVDSAVSDATERLSASRGSGQAVVSGLVDAGLAALEHDGPYGWGAPWPVLSEAWRIVPGWVHGIAGWRSAGKSALVDALVVGLAAEHDVAALVWSPEGAPSAEHMVRLASIRAAAWLRDPGEAVEPMQWVDERVHWIDHERRRTIPQILAAADAYAVRRPLHALVIDPFTSLDKFDADPGEPWDRMLNRSLTRLQGWARARCVAVLVVIHPKQRDRLADGTLPVCTSNDLHGGAMWGNQLDSLVSVWRDEQAIRRAREVVDVHVQKVRHDGKGGQMGTRVSLRRHADKGGRYYRDSHLEAVM